MATECIAMKIGKDPGYEVREDGKMIGRVYKNPTGKWVAVDYKPYKRRSDAIAFLLGRSGDVPF
ncbi:hypothetical protein LCGC14_0671680 [marine sediment metagenome]|uniref:Uncharacterized protein n=1 Tax=marine sediment metagenome TaxID=412755 RepID=A0A0F9RB21_9ZZZZ